MATRSNSSRDRILVCAGEIIDSAAITKGGFFQHFDSKTALAEGTIERYLVADMEIFDELLSRADEPGEDPLHQTLGFLKLLVQQIIAYRFSR